MANEKLKGISLSIGLETSDFKAGLNDIKRQITLATDAVKFWKQQLKLDPSNTAYLQNFNNALEDLTGLSQEAKGELKKLFDEFTQAGTSPSDERVKATVRELNSLDNTLNKAIPDYREFADTLDDGNGSLKQASDNFDEASEGASRLGDIIKGNLISDAIKYGVRELVDLTKELASAYVDILKGGIEYNASMETYTTSIKAMLNGDEEAANGVVEAMRAINKQSAFSNAALLDSAQQLIASDMSAEEATKSINDLAKALAYAGKSDDELKRMAQNLNQIKNAGKASAMDLKQFAYAGVPIYKLLAEYDKRRFGNGVDSKEDPATYEDIANALAKATEEGGKFFEAFTQQEGTYNYELNRLKSNWLDLTGVIAQDATLALSQTLLPAANETIEAMQKGFQEDGWIGAFNGFVDGLGNLADDIGKAYPSLSPIITTLKEFVENNVPKIMEMVDTFKKYVGSEEFTALVEGVAGMLTDVIDMVGYLVDIADKLYLIQVAVGFVQIAFNLLKDTVSLIRDIVAEIDEIISGEDDGMLFGNKYLRTNRGSNSGGFGDLTRSGGFGALQSGGYGNITLNASFVANGNLDEKQARRFASLMVEQINEELGVQL